MPEGKFSYANDHDYWICCYGRSGTKWLRRILLDNLGVFDQEKAQPARPHARGRVGLLHYQISPLPNASPAIYSHRDPRDILVSMAHYWKELGTIENVLNHRPDPAPPPLVAIGNMHRYWLEETEQITVLTSYRWLLEDLEGELRRICDKIGMEWKLTSEQLDWHRFENNADRLDVLKIKRTSLSLPREGAWKMFLNRAQGERVHNELWYWIEALGYDDNRAWWRELPEQAERTILTAA